MRVKSTLACCPSTSATLRFAELKPVFSAETSYSPTASRGASYRPAASVETVRTAPVSVLTILIVAPGMALPVASVARPEIEASPCARTGDGARVMASKTTGREARHSATERRRAHARGRGVAKLDKGNSKRRCLMVIS